MTTTFLSLDVVPMPESATLPLFHVPWCFGCGPENEHGLGMEARIEGDKVTADIEFAPRFQGGPGVVHGGGIATFFDDLMGFVPVAHQRRAVTAQMEIGYRLPVPLGASIRGEAWLAKVDGRKMWAESIGRDGNGTVHVEAKALFVEIGPDHFARTLDEMPDTQRSRLLRFQSDEDHP